MFTAAGGKWEQTSIAGHTANTLAKLRANVVAGDAPPAVQLKGPEIAEWNAAGMTTNLDELAAKEGSGTTSSPPSRCSAHPRARLRFDHQSRLDRLAPRRR